MIIRFQDTLVNLDNVQTIKKLGDAIVEVEFISGTRREFDAPFEELASALMGFDEESEEEQPV